MIILKAIFREKRIIVAPQLLVEVGVYKLGTGREGGGRIFELIAKYGREPINVADLRIANNDLQ
jgi:hypothetical protein